MPIQTITSAQALAHGALASGVKVVTSYPGSPSSETVEVLIELAEGHRSHVGHQPQRFASSFHANKQARKNRFSFVAGRLMKASIRFLT